jgi:hypothetical protein
MPILAYFSVVGAALLGLLFVADATLSPRGPLALSTEFHGIAAAMSGAPVSSNVTADSRNPALAPEPDMRSAAVKRASEGAPRPAAVPNLEPVNAPTATLEPAPKKRKPVARPAPAQEWRDQYAQGQQFDWNWGANRSGRDQVRRGDFWRNDSWRNDSWQDDSRRSGSRRDDSRRGDRRWGW